MGQKVIKSGHSLALTIPSLFVKMMGVKKGDEVKVERRPNKGVLVYHFQGVQQLTFKDKITLSLKKDKKS